MKTVRLTHRSAVIAIGLVAVGLAACDRNSGPGKEAEVRDTAAATLRPGPHSAGDPHVNLDADRLAQVALQHLDEGRVALAMETLDTAITRYPDAAELHGVRGSVFLEQGDIGAALTDIDSAVRLAPGNPLYLTNRAQIYRAFKRDGDAWEDLNRAVEIDPDLVSARFNRGSLAYSMGDLETAISDFEHCIALDPHMAPPYFNRAAVYDAMGERDLAVADLNRFIEIAPTEEWKGVAQELLEEWQKDGPVATDTESS